MHSLPPSHYNLHSLPPSHYNLHSLPPHYNKFPTQAGGAGGLTSTSSCIFFIKNHPNSNYPRINGAWPLSLTLFSWFSVLDITTSASGQPPPTYITWTRFTSEPEHVWSRWRVTSYRAKQVAITIRVCVLVLVLICVVAHQLLLYKYQSHIDASRAKHTASFFSELIECRRLLLSIDIWCPMYVWWICIISAEMFLRKAGYFRKKCLQQTQVQMSFVMR